MKLNLFFLSVTAMVNAAVGADPVQLGVSLGAAGNYAILSKAGITTTPGTIITGSIGVSPIAATAMTGFSLVLDAAGQFSTTDMVSGQVTAADYAVPTPSTLTTAVSDMETASADAAGRPNADAARINLGGGLLGRIFGGATAPMTPGVYTFGTPVSITGDIYLEGGANDIFIIQITGGLIQDAGTRVNLIGGALAKNIFWQVSSTVNVGATAHMEGVLLVKTSVTLGSGSTLNGRILGQTSVVLQAAAITEA